MAIPFTIILGAITTAIDKLFPDANTAAEHKLKVLELQQAGAFKELEAQLERDLAQIALNTEEAKSTSIFKSGWRPFIGWTCGFGLAYQFLFRPIVSYMVSVSGYAFGADMAIFPIMPELDIETLMTLLFGMLGLGVYRTYERVSGKVASSE